MHISFYDRSDRPYFIYLKFTYKQFFYNYFFVTINVVNKLYFIIK